MRFLLPLILCALACEVAPAESPDEVVARENTRVAQAKRRAEAQDRVDAEAKRKAAADAEQAEQQRRADAQRRKDADKESACATDRLDRRKHVQDAIDRAAREKARAAELDAYVSRSCQRKDVPDVKTEQYVDDKGFVQTRQTPNGHHEEIACPPDAPPELRPGGSGFPAGIVAPPPPDERAKNERCQDVPDVPRK